MELIIEAIIDILLKSGIIIVPLFLLGLIGWQYVLELYLFIYKVKKQRSMSVKDFGLALKTNNFDIIATKVSQPNLQNHFYYTFLKALYEHRHKSKQFLSSFYHDLFQRHLNQHFLSLNTVKNLSQAAPLLGLLGTVNGMIATFQVIALYGNSNPILMADGISEALLTTQAGLTVAFPLLFVQVLLKNQLNQIKKNLNSFFNELYQTKT